LIEGAGAETPAPFVALASAACIRNRLDVAPPVHELAVREEEAVVVALLCGGVGLELLDRQIGAA